MQNLWPEFDNEQLPAESAGRAQNQPASQRRRPTERAVLSSLRDWLLYDYIVPYCRSLGVKRIYRRCYWVDALGSAARTTRTSTGSALAERAPMLSLDEPGPAEQHGRAKSDSHRKSNHKQPPAQALPPILQPVALVAEELAKESMPIALYGLVLEESSRKRNAGTIPTIPKEGGIVRTGWPEAASTILQAIDQSAAIFLLNPFANSTSFSYEDLAPLYQRTAPTELCLFISHKQVETRLFPYLRTSAGASAFTTLLRTDRWKALLTNGTDTNQTVNGLIDALLTSIQKHFLFVQRIPLSMQPGPAVVESIPYTLLFATRRQDSLASMNDAVCINRRHLQEQSHLGVLTEAWFIAQQQEAFAEEIRQLYQRVLQLGRSHRLRRWPALRQELLVASFGQFTLQDYDKAICQLLQNGEVRCEWRQKPSGTPTNQEHPIPGDDDTLLWT
jgi:hypothetical protein